ncbi:hypothetical protein ACH3XW_21255 [Acanthocheilonema viteae]
MPVQYPDNMEQLLAFADSSKFDFTNYGINENSVLGYLESQELNTAKSNPSMMSAISAECAFGNSFSMDQNDSLNSS